MQCSIIKHLPRESSREHPCSCYLLSLSAAAEGLSTASFPGHSLKLCFLPVEVLVEGTQQCIIVGAVL